MPQVRVLLLDANLGRGLDWVRNTLGVPTGHFELRHRCEQSVYGEAFWLLPRMVKKLILAARKGSLPDRRLMPLPAHSTSADHPVVPCNAPFRYPRSPLDLAMGRGAGSACPGD